jgi:hypothetical protein
MTAVARTLARVFPSISNGDGQVTTVAIFCGLGLLASLSLVAICGIDLSPGLF